jgi:hypothetical protein
MKEKWVDDLFMENKKMKEGINWYIVGV